MVAQKTYTFKGSNDRLIAADLTYMAYPEAVPICVFAHGFKGFKDWGAWPLAAQIFAVKGIPLFKFNFSHNGTTPANPTEFTDLEAFGNNNLSKELEDLGKVIDFLERKAEQLPFAWNGELFVLGHSRGGAIAMIRAVQDKRINKVASWSAPADLQRYLQMTDPDEWLRQGVHYIPNARTGQQMPIYVQFYLDLVENKGTFHLLEQIEELEQDLLIVHGTADETVALDDARKIHDAVIHAVKVEIPDAGHTYGITHPVEGKKISLAFAQAVDETIEFFLM